MQHAALRAPWLEWGPLFYNSSETSQVALLEVWIWQIKGRTGTGSCTTKCCEAMRRCRGDHVTLVYITGAKQSLAILANMGTTMTALSNLAASMS